VTAGLAYSEAFLHHDAGPHHPERPDRVRAIASHLRQVGLWDRFDVWEPAPIAIETLELVHTPAHVQAMQALAARGGGSIDADTHTSAGSWEAALRAAGGVVQAADRVSAGQLGSAFCLVRPPGHHATPKQAMGFCLFNNVAIAAEWLRANGRAERIAILDYDVHHGNGTQDAFYNRPDILYVSTHQVPLYPGTGDWRQTGGGTTVNLTMPPGSGDDVYAVARSHVIEPIVRRFRPDVIFVSLGFDAFYGDPLANLRLSIGGAYTALLRSARDLADELCGGKIVVALEGGYDLDALAHGGGMVCHLLLGEEPPADPLGPAPDQLPVQAVQPLLDVLRELHHVDS
jgi:acetoin utilization deacetylase AcuC-like enzyme